MISYLEFKLSQVPKSGPGAPKVGTTSCGQSTRGTPRGTRMPFRLGSTRNRLRMVGGSSWFNARSRLQVPLRRTFPPFQMRQRDRAASHILPQGSESGPFSPIAAQTRADRTGRELLPLEFVALHFRQTADGKPLQTTMQRRAAQLRDRGPKCIEAIVERQQGVLANGNDNSLLRRSGQTRSPVSHRDRFEPTVMYNHGILRYPYLELPVTMAPLLPV